MDIWSNDQFSSIWTAQNLSNKSKQFQLNIIFHTDMITYARVIPTTLWDYGIN